MKQHTVLRHGPGYRPSCPLVAPPLYPDSSPPSSPAATTARTALRGSTTQQLVPILPKPTASESPGERHSISGKAYPVHISPEITKPFSSRTTPHHSASHTLPPAQHLVWSEVLATGHPGRIIDGGPNSPAKAKPYDRPLPLGAQSFNPTPIKKRPRLGDAPVPSTCAPLSPSRTRTPSSGSDEYRPRQLSIDREYMYTINGHRRAQSTSGPR